MKTDLYQQVTNKILTELEAGAAPWVKPWSSAGYADSMPANASSGRAYSGINIVLLWMAQDEHKFTSNRWLTFKQALDLGGHVRKGEKGSTVVYVNAIEREEDVENGETEMRRIPFLKRFTVFNVAQCEGLPADIGARKAEPINNDTRAELADEFISATGARITEGTGQAYYRPGEDDISLPSFEAFKSADHYYATTFHEIGHWTGHKRRLDRDLKGRFGTKAYAAEELIAEITSAFLCAEFSFDGDLRHAGYIDHWIEILKADSRAFFTAAAKAQKAADYLRGLALADRQAA